MPLSAGSRLGPYEILAPLGAGGMGEVWRGRDTRLDRSVAIKILSAEFAQNAQFKLRFEREAKAISQLNHPHICTLYDVGENYLVMELLEGESLADRLTKGPLPLEQVLRYGVQIADALDKAHRAGIIHRDLKPGNIMLTKSGAKLLDFGLAKTSAPVDLQGATQHKPLTQEGTIVGTFQYMAPEQLEGLEADARTDIFAFGTVLYEMATGHRAFEGKTKTSLIAAIVKENPRPMAELQPLTPPALEHVVNKCLSKDPDDRWQNAHDIAEELRWVRDSSNAGLVTNQMRKARGVTLSLFAAFAIGVVVAAAAAYVLRGRFEPARPVTRLLIALPADASLTSYGPNSIAISPSGRMIAYVVERGGSTQLYIRNLSSIDAVLVAGTEGASAPFFSSDSQWIGFSTGSHLLKVGVDGGAPQTICEASESRGASWRGDLIVFNMGTSGIWSVPATGGTPRWIARPSASAGDVNLLWPELLPDGEHLLVGVTRADRSDVVALSVSAGVRTLVARDAASAQYFKNGYLLVSRDSSLLVGRFDIKHLRLIGPLVPVVEGVVTIAPFQRALYSVSDDGNLIYVPGGTGIVKHELTWVDRSGHRTTAPFPLQQYEEPRLSPDGTHVAMAIRPRSAAADIWTADLSRNTLTRLTFDPTEEETAAWTPDGQRIAYAALHGVPSIFWRRADGTGPEELLASTSSQGGHLHTGAFSPDGRTIAYTDYSSTSAADIWVMSLADRKPRPFVATPFNERGPRFSPDGKFIAYTSNETGRDEIYVQSFPGPGGKWQISDGGGREPVWSPTGKEVFYRNGDRMMAVDVEAAALFRARTPHQLFAGHFVPMRRGEASYDVSRDGTRFLMVQLDQSGGPQHLVVALDWFGDVLRRLARADSQ